MRKLTCLFFFVGAFVQSAGAFEFATSRGNGLGQTIVLSRPSASDVLLIPSGQIPPGQLKIELGANRQFEIKEFDRGFVAAVYRRGPLTYSAGVSQFGDGELYSERTVRFGLGYRYDSLSIGASFSAMQVDFNDRYDRLGAESFGLSLGYHRGVLHLATVAENLNSPGLDQHSEPILPRYTLYAELMGPGPYSITGRLAAQKDVKPRFGVGQIIDISSTASIFWGLSTEPIIYGGGLELSYKRSFITYAASHHPTLGFSHTLSVSFQFGGS